MKIIIIYNPKSTGNSQQNAKALEKQLRTNNKDVSLFKTTHPGHGEELAAKYAAQNQEVMLISSSGDGGYHEVVNGVLSHSTKKVVVGVLPSGNANDHASAVGSNALLEAILEKDIQYIDTIKVSGTVDGKPWTRYAHSYAGIGVTATAAKRLTEERPNALTEKWIVAHSLLSFRYVKVTEKGKLRRYSSVLFGNIDRMSKVIKLSENSSITDGKFEMSTIPFRSKLRLLIYLLTAAIVGLRDARSLSRYTCRTIHPTPIQLDGEFFMLDAKSTVTVESVKRNLRCVI